jgi:hypothetical protein
MRRRSGDSFAGLASSAVGGWSCEGVTLMGERYGTRGPQNSTVSGLALARLLVACEGPALIGPDAYSMRARGRP